MFLTVEISCRGDGGIRRVNLRGNYSSGAKESGGSNVNLKALWNIRSITTEWSLMRHDFHGNGIDINAVFRCRYNDRTRNAVIEFITA